MILVDMIGKTFTQVFTAGSDELIFRAADGSGFRFFHIQDCCETVDIVDICGDLLDLVGTPMLIADESTSDNINPPEVKVPEYQDSFTWTFYRFATIKGSVTVRWYGSSNGYYSESVNFAAL